MPDRSTTAPKRYVFLLLPGFSQLGFTCALEALSLANRFDSGRAYYSWRVLGETGDPVAAWNGVTVMVDSALAPLERDETLVVCAGEHAGQASTRPVLNWLRRETRKGMDYGALSSGTYTLALAGLIGGKRVTTHWEYQNALQEVLPEVVIQDSIFSVDGRLFTTAGGAASMDMMLHRIRGDYGHELATWVADQMIYTSPRANTHAQRMVLQHHADIRNSKLGIALDIMRNTVEDPLTSEEIAQAIELSVRQLERLFARHVGVSPKRHYLQIRLEKARHLLRQTQMSITEICVSCGFKSQSHFSKSYRAAFGASPSSEKTGSKPLW